MAPSDSPVDFLHHHSNSNLMPREPRRMVTRNRIIRGNELRPIASMRSLSLSGILQARTRQVEACVAQVFNVRHESLRASTRGKADVARARQVAMYMCHTSLAYSLTTVGQLFDRDRTTVGHACRLVEDLRDDADFDAMMVCLERAVEANSMLVSNCAQLTT